jgi:hypothetical protein
MHQETIKKYLIKVLILENPGKLDDEAEREAEAVMMYYEQIKRAEIMFLNE